MIDAATFEKWKQWARRDDWHTLFVGSDIRQMLGEIERLAPPTDTRSIEGNQVITPAQSPGKDDNALETIDGAGDQVEAIGAPVTFPKYTPPRDKRVQDKLRAAEAERKASREPPPLRPTFTDPRLDPKYKPPKK